MHWFVLLLYSIYWLLRVSANPLQPHYGPGVDSPSHINDYQEYFLG
jgi:hypothetical protein